jgi:hypothetical protein
MSENPPGIGPPLQYSNYPRGQGVYGSPERLQALSDGYFGLNLVFGLNVVLVIAARAAQLTVASSSTVDPATMLLVICVSLGVIGFAVGFCTYPFNKKIGYGCGWSPAGPVIASVLMGLNSAFCCGIIGYVVVQQIAGQEIKRYGIKTGFFGLRKKEIAAVIASMRAHPPGPTYPPAP